MVQITENAILEGIVKQDEYILRKIYTEYFPRIEHMITNNSGRSEDAEDVFQDALVILYNKLKTENFVLSSSVYTFIYAVCKNLWYQGLRDKSSQQDVSLDFDLEEEGEDLNASEELKKVLTLEDEKFNLYQKHFLKLSKDCQRIISLFLKKFSLKEIANKMGINEKYAKTRKYMCKKMLIDNIKLDPEGSKFFENE